MNPTPKQIRDARLAAGLSQTDLARLLFGNTARGKVTISEYERGINPMPESRWELMQYKLRIRTKV